MPNEVGRLNFVVVMWTREGLWGGGRRNDVDLAPHGPSVVRITVGIFILFIYQSIGFISLNA